jgi:hypothetical protein
MGYQKTSIDGQTIQCPEEKRQMDKQYNVQKKKDKSTVRQYNVQKKKDKRTNNDLKKNHYTEN